MKRARVLTSLGLTLALAAGSAGAGEKKAFTWSTQSEEAMRLLRELQGRIENFQFGPEAIELAKKVAAADAEFAMGQYYLSVMLPPAEGQPVFERSQELAKQASDGERRFVEAMVVVRANQGANFREGIPHLEALAKDYPDERLVFAILGQLYAGAGEAEKARAAYERAQQIGPKSNRIRAFLANDDLLKGEYARARASFLAVEKDLPQGSAPFSIRYGVAFSHLYEGNPDAALASLETYLEEYRSAGNTQAFPEVFIWNSIGRIHLETGQLDKALAAYQKGYESVPGSPLPEDQKQVWLGRLHHGKCRVLAKMGQHEQAWKEAETIRAMIEEGGEDAKVYWPAYHYVAGYAKLEKGEIDAAIEHLKQSDLTDPFQKLLLARAYERKGDREAAKKAYQEVLGSTNNGIERALAYPEAKKKLDTL